MTAKRSVGRSVGRSARAYHSFIHSFCCGRRNRGGLASRRMRNLKPQPRPHIAPRKSESGRVSEKNQPSAHQKRGLELTAAAKPGLARSLAQTNSAHSLREIHDRSREEVRNREVALRFTRTKVKMEKREEVRVQRQEKAEGRSQSQSEWNERRGAPPARPPVCRQGTNSLNLET